MNILEISFRMLYAFIAEANIERVRVTVKKGTKLDYCL